MIILPFVRPPRLQPQPCRHRPTQSKTRWVALHCVAVRQSLSKNAGVGVFAQVDLPARRVMGDFAAAVLTIALFEASYAGRAATYVLRIDASDGATGRLSSALARQWPTGQCRQYAQPQCLGVSATS